MRKATLLTGCFLILGVAASAQDASTWKEFRPAEMDFSALFPGTPESKTTNAQAFTTDRFAVLSGSGGYIVARQSYSVDVSKGRTVDQILDIARDGAVNQVKGNLMSETKIKLQDKYPGRELRVSLPDGKTIFRVRVIWANSRTYSVAVAGDSQFVETKDAQRFLDSFKLAATK